MREYEEGYYHFRATMTSKNNELEVMYSDKYYIENKESMKLAKEMFTTDMGNLGYKNINITHEVCAKDSEWAY